MEDMQRQLVVMVDELKRVKGEMVSQEMYPSSVSDYRVQVFKGSDQIFVWVFFFFFVINQGPQAHTLKAF